MKYVFIEQHQAEFGIKAMCRVLATNQGLYNGFLAAGLLWGLWLGDSGFQFKFFFLLCVLIAGVFGAPQPVRRSFIFRGSRR